MHPKLRTALKFGTSLGLSLPTFLFFADHVANFQLVRGNSMAPTFARDLILVRRWGVHENLKRGQVVLLRSPINPENVAIKRIVALEGDIVRPRPTYPLELVTVPEGRVWVEGDEGFHSVDSNTYGPISAGLITGRVTHIVLPLGRAGRVREDYVARRGALLIRAEDYYGH